MPPELDPDALTLFFAENVFTLQPEQDANTLENASTIFLDSRHLFSPPFDYQAVGRLWHSIDSNKSITDDERDALKNRVLESIPDKEERQRLTMLVAMAEVERHHTLVKTNVGICDELSLSLPDVKRYLAELRLTSATERPSGGLISIEEFESRTGRSWGDMELMTRRIALNIVSHPDVRDDAVQVARIGLLKAAARYEEGRGPFAPYAYATVSGEVKRLVRDTSWSVKVDRRTQEKVLQLRRIREELRQNIGREPTDHQVNALLGPTPEQFEALKYADSIYRPNSLSSGGPDGTGYDIGDAHSGDSFQHAEDILELDTLLHKLPPRSAEIVRLYYLEEWSQSKIAEELGISQMHVSRLLRRSLAMLREEIQ